MLLWPNVGWKPWRERAVARIPLLCFPLVSPGAIITLHFSRTYHNLQKQILNFISFWRGDIFIGPQSPLMMWLTCRVQFVELFPVVLLVYRALGLSQTGPLQCWWWCIKITIMLSNFQFNEKNNWQLLSSWRFKLLLQQFVEGSKEVENIDQSFFLENTRGILL